MAPQAEQFLIPGLAGGGGKKGSQDSKPSNRDGVTLKPDPKDKCKQTAVLTLWLDKQKSKDVGGCSGSGFANLSANVEKALKLLKEWLAKQGPFRCCPPGSPADKCELKFDIELSTAPNQPAGSKPLVLYCSAKGMKAGMAAANTSPSEHDGGAMDPRPGGIVLIAGITDFAAGFLESGAGGELPSGGPTMAPETQAGGGESASEWTTHVKHFFNIALHEFLHALGFEGESSAAGNAMTKDPKQRKPIINAEIACKISKKLNACDEPACCSAGAGGGAAQGQGDSGQGGSAGTTGGGYQGPLGGFTPSTGALAHHALSSGSQEPPTGGFTPSIGSMARYARRKP